MNKYIFDENNSGGYTIVCECLGIVPENGVENEYVLVIAKDINEAVSKFDDRFDIDSDYQSSYEGGSCSCCGRRFTIRTNDKNAERDYDGSYIEIYYKEDLSYYDDLYIIE